MSETDVKCVDLRCSSNNFQYSSCKVTEIPPNAPITSVEVENKISSSPCTLNDTFGFNLDLIWVDKGCRADFEVCFQRYYTATSTTQTLDHESDNSEPVFNSTVPPTSDQTSNSAGLIGGLLGGFIIIAILVIVVVLLLRRFPDIIRLAKKKQFPDSTDYVGNQNVAHISPANTNVAESIAYSTLQDNKETHHYTQLSAKNENILKPSSYMTVYDSFDSKNYHSSEINNFDYECVDTQNGHGRLEGPKQYDYADFSGNKNNMVIPSGKGDAYQPGNYHILDPKNTGFNRGQNVQRDVNGETYELAKPLSDTENPYLPSVDGVYDQTNNSRRDTSNVLYSHSVDNMYDSTSHNRIDKSNTVDYSAVDSMD